MIPTVVKLRDKTLDAVEVGRMPRLVSSGLSAIMLSAWISIPMAAAWVAAIWAWELVISPPLSVRVREIGERDAAQAMWLDTGVILVGALQYVWGWALAWVVGGAEAAAIAMLWFAGSFLHGLLYFSDRPGAFWACVGPALVVGLTVPWLHGPWQASLSIVIVAGFFVVTALRGVKDRNRLLDSAVAAATAKQAAERANEQKSQFLASMSHELRTPLTSVIGYAELIADEASSEGREDTAADALRIRTAAKHLLGLVNEILDLAKIEAGRMEVSRTTVDLAAMFEEVGAILAPLAASNGNSLTVDAEGAQEAIVTDAGKLKQCLLNLGGNACKFTRCGRVRIVATLEDVAQDGARTGGRTLRVTVSDTGPGIPPAVADRLFQPFVQAETSLSSRPDGTGLGLAITRKLAELLGGTVSLDPSAEKGASFTLQIAAPYPPNAAMARAA